MLKIDSVQQWNYACVLPLTVMCGFLFAPSAAMFANEMVKPGDDKVVEYDFVVEHRVSMVTFDDKRGTGRPVLSTASGFMKRVQPSRDPQDCSRLLAVTPEEYDSIIVGDGSYKKVVAINGTIPGPPIVVTEGTQVVVRVHNRLIQEGITLHWHGMVQQKTPYMDGVGSVSQCPIAPGEFFTYRFRAYPQGTHWYHSHLGTTRSDGLFGPLIVLPTENQTETYDKGYDKEFMMVVHDWTREDSRDVTNEVYWEMERFNPGYGDTSKCYYQTRQFDGSEIGPSPSVSILVNGKGFHFPRSSRFLPIDVNISQPQENAENRHLPLERFDVVQNRWYRFRVIGTAMLYALNISIDQHSLVILSSDGNPVSEERVSSLIINTGERFDFILFTSQPKSNYWIRVETLDTTDNGDNGQRIPQKNWIPTKGFAVLHYDGAEDGLPTSSPAKCTPEVPCRIMNCPYRFHIDENRYNYVFVTNLTARRGLLQRFPVPQIPSEGKLFEKFLNFHFSGATGNAQRSSVNGHQMILPSAPPQIYPKYNPFTSCPEPCTEHCVCTYVVKIPLGSVVQLTLLNMGTGSGLIGTAHPVHIHGHHFHVMKMGFPNYDKNGLYQSDNTDIQCDPERRCNNAWWSDPSWKGDSVPGLLTRPPIKDTVIVPVGGYVVLRFTADNPGYWFAHCHIEIHQVEGMAFIIQEGEDSQMPALPNGFPTCGNFDWSAADFEKAENATPDGKKNTDGGLSGGAKAGISVAVVLAILLVIVCVLCFRRYRGKPMAEYNIELALQPYGTRH